MTYFIFFLMVMLASLSLAACVSTQRTAAHAFSFDTRRAIPAVEVLDFRYGDSSMPGVHPEEWELKQGRIGQMTNVNGSMLVGDTLYVKWRIKDTGEVLQDYVDLRHRLPSDMKDKRVAFYIVDRQLYVYVADQKFLPVGASEAAPAGAPIKNLPFTYHTKYQMIYIGQPRK
ncbi:hypothetical protein [Cupriavidus sp. D384]|uniref:hypothetical protein n=1 Tax=Cupriavidus sp. D384 TaxID=1538095 RepID=UPI00082A327D|nr:hypothetical protein [Cupriavidus sp. D384]